MVSDAIDGLFDDSKKQRLAKKALNKLSNKRARNGNEKSLSEIGEWFPSDVEEQQLNEVLQEMADEDDIPLVKVLSGEFYLKELVVVFQRW